MTQEEVKKGIEEKIEAQEQELRRQKIKLKRCEEIERLEHILEKMDQIGGPMVIGPDYQGKVEISRTIAKALIPIVIRFKKLDLV